MMRKLFILGLLAGCSHVASAAPQTFDEAYQSLSEKVKMRDDSALETADQVLALAQTNEQKARVYLQIGNANFGRDKPATARFQYAKVLILSNLDSALKNTALVMIATTYQLQYPPDYVKTRETFQRIKDGKEFSAQEKLAARLQIASTYKSEGNDAQARARYLDVATDKSVETWARLSAFLLLAESERFQGKGVAARAYYERAIVLSAGDISVGATALDGMAQSYVEEKKFELARQKFAEILALEVPKAPDYNRSALETLQAGAQINIARTYNSEGDKTRARAEYAEVLKMPAAEIYADQIKSELAQIDKELEFAR